MLRFVIATKRQNSLHSPTTNIIAVLRVGGEKSLSTGAEHSTSAAFLLLLLLGDGDDVDGDRVETHALEEVLGVRVDVQLTTLGVLGEVQGRDLGHVLILAFTFFLLEFERDATDRTTLDTFHQVCGVTRDLFRNLSVSLSFFSPSTPTTSPGVFTHLVTETLRWDDCNFIAYPLVGLEVESELGVVPLDDDLGGLLDRLNK